MFKKIDLSKGSPIYMVEATIYMFGSDYDLYKEWNDGHTSPSMIKEKLANIQTSSLKSGMILSFEAGPVRAADVCGVLNQSGSYTDNNVKMMELGFSHTMYFLAVTETGMPITQAEKEELLACAMAIFTDIAANEGALYMVVDANGEKSCWHNDASYFQYSTEKKSSIVGQLYRKSHTRKGVPPEIIEEDEAKVLDALEDYFSGLAKAW